MIERISKLFNNSEKSVNAILSEMNLSSGIYNGWTVRKSKPSVEAVQKIAEYFGVSTDYLINGEEFDGSKRVLSEVDELMNQLDRPMQAMAKGYIKELVRQQEQIKKIKQG